MSITILPYIDNQTTQSLRETSTSATQTQSTKKEAIESFQSYLSNATRAQQAMAVDALIAASATGAVSNETVQKLLGFNPQGTVSQAATTDSSSSEAASDTSAASASSSSSSSSSGTLSCSDELEGYFKEASETYNVDINLLKAIAKAESGFNPSATSSAGAMGIMQLMPSTASSLGISDAYDAHDNIMGGAKIISQNLKKYDGDVSLALAAYNAGSGNVDKYGGIPPFTETQNYVKKVLNYYENASDK
jgi:soluble lytic murein transglycosylase-like protein